MVPGHATGGEGHGGTPLFIHETARLYGDVPSIMNARVTSGGHGKGRAEGATAFDAAASSAIPFYNGHACFLLLMTGW